MNKSYYYKKMQGGNSLDYEKYIRTQDLLQCQKPYEKLCHHDELQFQIIHQSMELWLKLLIFTLLEINDLLQEKKSFKILTLFNRVHKMLENLTNQLELMDTMSPYDYQTIRRSLGQGSGQESPGFRALKGLEHDLWESFQQHYLKEPGLDLDMIYSHHYNHCESYMIAEAMLEYDQKFQQFRQRHMLVVKRSIGLETQSLKGHAVEILNKGIQTQFFPQLWAIRSKMSNQWNQQYKK